MKTSLAPCVSVPTIVELLRSRAREHPQQVIYTFLRDGEEVESEITLEDLDRRARTFAGLLQRHAEPGERALLLYPSGLEFIVAFLGCLYAGVVAVPAYPPGRSQTSRLRAIAKDATPRVVLTHGALPRRTQGDIPELQTAEWLKTGELADELAEDWQEPTLDGQSLAFLQYTSGSTATPKGVMIRHSNLLANEEMIRQAFAQNAESVIVGWLPLYHDMGLIGNVLQPLYVGARCILMSPVAFLQKPIRWLQAISRHRATTSGAPNFAYDLCVRKVSEERRTELDLSSWQLAFCGAEPVRAETLQRFAEAFAPCGFRRQAFYPCYGLAEATLFVTGSAAGTPAVTKSLPSPTEGATGQGKQALVGCGRTWMGQQVVIVDPEKRTLCPPSCEGEIWVAGASVAAGYWDQPEETAHVFQAKLSDGQEGTFLRTGDLGFLDGEELFITGRRKDLIILRGRNLYPQDIEWTVERSHRALRAGCGAAFSVEITGEERLVVVQELKRRRDHDLDFEAVVDAVRRAVATEHEAQVHDVVLLRTGTILKTSSGKIQRRACRDLYLEGSLEALGRPVLADEAVAKETSPLPVNPSSLLPSLLPLPLPQRQAMLVETLRREVARAAKVDASRLTNEQPITSLGLDSLSAVDLQHRLEVQFGVLISFADLLVGPTLDELAQRIATSLTESSLTETSGITAHTPSTDDADEFPLSHGQRALWFLHRLAPESSAYNIAAAAHVRSPLDLGALHRALQALVERHEAMRTTFLTPHGEPVQRVHATLPAEFLAEDTAQLDDVQLMARLEETSQRVFDLEKGPLLRLAVFRRPEGGHALLFVIHHLVADFWSLAVLARELGAFYAVLYADQGKTAMPDLPPPALRYHDHVKRQEEYLASDQGEHLWSYWREQLAGAPEQLDLPTDRPRPPQQTFHGAARNLRFSNELTSGLQSLAHSQGTTLYTTLLASFQSLLALYSGQRDFVVGSPTAGRSTTDQATVLGYFVNPVVLRADLSGDPTFGDILGRVRHTVLGAFKHHDYPFSLLAEKLLAEKRQTARDPSRSPIFQVMFVLQTAPRGEEESLAALALNEAGTRIEFGRLQLESIALAEHSSQFDLSLRMAELQGALVASLQYNTDLFDPTTAHRLLLHFQQLLRSVVAAPEQRLSSLPFLTAAERNQLLREWNDTESAKTVTAKTETLVPKVPRCLHALFEAQVARSPKAEALVFESERLTYGELNRRADRVAQILRHHGVRRGDLVGLCFKRSPTMVIALLAVLKAGGAYVPLDPVYPRQRLAFMLEDSKASVVLTQEELTPSLPTTVISVCLDYEPVFEGETERFQGTVEPRDLAYVIYTSGSTGRPKGVAIEHRSAAAFLAWAADRFTAEDLGGVLASTSICFDLSIFELFLPLACGGKVVLAQNALELKSLPAASEVTLVNTVPSAISELLQSVAIPPSVRTVNLAGEPLKRDLVKRIYELTTVERVFNLYGPSEDTTYSSWTLTERGSEQPVTIGRPVDNTQIYLLNRHLWPVGLGGRGELCLGGSGLARGYFGRPSLTAQFFIPDPFARQSGSRLYRTGDLARHRSDGHLLFLGRVDHQVKLRGFRVELGEIEAALCQDPAVAEAVVMAHQLDTEDPHLVAYVECPSQPKPPLANLRARLRQNLPEYMVPSFFVLLLALPRTNNGKVDRVALRRTEVRGPEGEEKRAPTTPVEELLLGIWGELLDAPNLGTEDNFFEHGGHSLKAAQMVSRIYDVLEVDLPVTLPFEAPTISRLAKRIEQARRSEANAPVAAPITALTSGGPHQLSFAQQRLWFLDQLEPGTAVYNIAHSADFRGLLNTQALAHTFQEIVHRHASLRTTFTEAGGQPVQVIASPEKFSLPTVDLSALDEVSRNREKRRLSREEARRPFDLTTGPLLRITLLRLGPTRHTVLLSMHHIISDGWSMGVLIQEMTSLYPSFDAPGGNRAPWQLRDLPIQYPDFAIWQQNWLQGEVLDALLAYWRQRLTGVTALELPTDRFRPAIESFRGTSRPVAFSRRLTGALQEVSRAGGATLYMTLLAAYQFLLSTYSGQQNVAVGSPIANRRRSETEDLIGFFANTLVMRNDLAAVLRDEDPSFRRLLHQVRAVTLGAYAHQDMPFEVLVNALQPERDMSRNPLFQVMLAYQNAPRPALQLPGLELELHESESGVSKFEFTLSLWQEEERLAGTFEYRTDLFDPTTAQRFLGQFETLLEGIAEDATRPLASYSVYSPAEQHQLLLEWSTGETTPSAPSTPGHGEGIHHLFEDQVLRTPEATAVVWGEERLCYRELNRRANRLAHHLRTLNVGPEVPVAVALGRSTHLIVAVLGVLKTGAIFAPLDCTYPKDRLAFMLHDAKPQIVLTDGEMVHHLPPHESPTILLDAEAGGLVQHPTENLERQAAAQQLAYLIYTSGSTGRPKGVALPHRVLTNLIRWQLANPRFGSAARTLQFAASSFDVFLQEIFSTLCSGGALHMISEDIRRDPEQLLALLEAEGIQRLFLPFVALQQLAEVAEGTPPSALEEVITAGEQLQISHPVREFFAQASGCTLENQYGPSESHVVTAHPLPLEATQWPTLPPIGRPVSRFKTYLLNAHLQPTPPRVAGELWLSGVGLARGYFHRPALTAEKFLPHPFSDEPGARLYRTGDLARYRADGEIDFLGRIDHQVKIRGFRIELGEIEAVLSSHPSVQEASVLVQENGRLSDGLSTANKRLVAYFAAHEKAEPPPAKSELQKHLQRTLPDYMVPAVFVQLNALPLGPTGKVDRRALPAPRPDSSEKAFATPDNPVQEVLAELWARVLGTERVGIHANFFEMGGHSLLATQLISRVSSTFQVELPLRALFKAPTVEGLAQVIVAREAKPGRSEKIARMLLKIRSISKEELNQGYQNWKSAGGAA